MKMNQSAKCQSLVIILVTFPWHSHSFKLCSRVSYCCINMCLFVWYTTGHGTSTAETVVVVLVRIEQ